MQSIIALIAASVCVWLDCQWCSYWHAKYDGKPGARKFAWVAGAAMCIVLVIAIIAGIHGFKYAPGIMIAAIFFIWPLTAISEENSDTCEHPISC